MKTALAPAPDTSYTKNRELSWLKFNERILQAGNDISVPLMERLKFISSFVGNLDEFFMLRVGSMFDLSVIDEAHTDNKSGMTMGEQLKEIFKLMPPLYKRKDAALAALESQLAHFGIVRLGPDSLDDEDQRFLDNYFERVVAPVLSPQIVDARQPFPHIENRSLNVAVMLKDGDESKFGVIPVPRLLQRMIFLKNGLARFILSEDVVLRYAAKVFEAYTVEEKAVFSVTRNADMNPDDETYDFEEDFRHHMKNILRKRPRLRAVRLEVSYGTSKRLTGALMQKLILDKAQVFHSAAPLEMSYVYALEEQLPPATKRAVSYVPYIPQYPAGINARESVMKQASAKDLLLAFPYESMEPFLRLIREAAADPSVISVKITLGSLDTKSRLAQYLIAAAENNKDVTVVVEPGAGPDGQNSTGWAERLEEAGCKLVYGFKGYGVHTAVCLITRHDKGRLQYITQIGTGGYNERTARLHADFSLITARDDIGGDVSGFFKSLLASSLEGRYSQLLVGPAYLKSALLSLIDGEIGKAKNGKPALVLIKTNALTDRDILDKLQAASNAGVKVRLLVRGVCCLLPGIPSRTDNVSVASIIGRFPEHARVYCFGEGEGMKMFIASADLMTRDTERRIELACPVLDAGIRTRLLDILQIQLSDAVKAWKLGPDGDYKMEEKNGLQINCQDFFMKEAMKPGYEDTQEKRYFQQRLDRVRDFLKIVKKDEEP
jgi:polyphosphate kinase